MLLTPRSELHPDVGRYLRDARTDRLPEPTAEHLTAMLRRSQPSPLTVTIFGGINAVPDQLLDPLTADPDTD